MSFLSSGGARKKNTRYPAKIFAFLPFVCYQINITVGHCAQQAVPARGKRAVPIALTGWVPPATRLGTVALGGVFTCPPHCVPPLSRHPLVPEYQR